MSVVDRLNHVIDRLKEGDKDPDVDLALSHQSGEMYIDHVLSAMEEIRDSCTIGPSALLHNRRINGIGRFMMEDLEFCETGLGREIFWILRSVRLMMNIERSLLAANRKMERNTGHRHLSRVIELLEEMKSAFDEDWNVNYKKVARLSNKIKACVKKSPDLEHGELGDEIYYFVTW